MLKCCFLMYYLSTNSDNIYISKSLTSKIYSEYLLIFFCNFAEYIFFKENVCFKIYFPQKRSDLLKRIVAPILFFIFFVINSVKNLNG
jgi:hypothetical protein